MLILLGALLLGMVLIGVRWFITADAAQINRVVRYSFITLATLALILLALSGRVAGLLVGVIAFLPFIAYIQIFRKDDGTIHNSNHDYTMQILTPEALPPIMTQQQALDILGLNELISHQQIIDAHRRLIQKIHPNKGGSLYLAAQVNQAKETLLNNVIL